MHLVPARALGRAAALALAVLLAPVGTVAVDLAAPQAVCAEPSKALKEEALPIIQEGLKSDDPQTKAWAILSAGALGDKNLNKELLPYLANTNRELRQAAIVALAGQKDKAGLDALRKELADAKGGRFVVMAELLSRLPVGPRVDLLKEFALSKKPDAGLRADALRYLAEREVGEVFNLLGEVVKLQGPDQEAFLQALIADPRKEAFPWAKKLMEDKKSPAARLGGLKLAIAIGGAEVDPLVRVALKDADPKVAELALSYLLKAKDPSAGDFLASKLSSTPSSALLDLAKQVLDTRTKVPLAVAQKLIADDKGGDTELTFALYALLGATQDPAAFEQLKTLEQSTLIEERRKGVYGLGYTSNPAAVTILARTINDGNADLRLYSARGLGQLNQASGVEVLQKTLQRTSDKPFQRELVGALARIEHPSATKALIFKASDGDTETRKLVMDGLERAASKDSISVLEILANDNDADIRWRATLLIVRLDEGNGLARLERALQRPPEGYTDQILALPREPRRKVLALMLNAKEEKLRSDAFDAILLDGADGLELTRLLTSDKQPAHIRTWAIERLLGMLDDKDTDLFKSLAQTGNDEQKMQALVWLHRKSSPALGGFFRTFMNGSKDSAPRRLAALYGLLRSEG